MRRYVITDRRQVGGVAALLRQLEWNDSDGVEMIQIREKDLGARELYDLTREVVRVCRHAKILVNSRADVAVAAGAHGLHLPGESLSPRRWRSILPKEFLIGVSCHTEQDLREAAGADFAVYGPVFPPRSKAAYGPSLGIDGLRAGVAISPVPVFALGGIDWANASECIRAGADGIAGISLFQQES